MAKDTIKGQVSGGASRSRATATARHPVSPTTRTFEAFTHYSEKRPRARSSVQRRINSTRMDLRHHGLKIAVLGAITLAVIAVLVLSSSGPKEPWVFDRPEAQLPSLQTKHTLY
jgi:hypothetical protein